MWCFTAAHNTLNNLFTHTHKTNPPDCVTGTNSYICMDGGAEKCRSARWKQARWADSQHLLVFVPVCVWCTDKQIQQGMSALHLLVIWSCCSLGYIWVWNWCHIPLHCIAYLWCLFYVESTWCRRYFGAHLLKMLSSTAVIFFPTVWQQFEERMLLLKYFPLTMFNAEFKSR